MKRELAILLFLTLIFFASGCVSSVQSSPYANATAGKLLYDLGNTSHWSYAVNMTASNVSSTWNMTVDNYAGNPRHQVVATLGNGMDIVYDIWWNSSSYRIERMHAKGSTGGNYQDQDVSPLQINTLPDTGLVFYLVPFQPIGKMNVKNLDGQAAALTVFAATDNHGFTLEYWNHPAIPVPVKILEITKDYNITMMLTDYKIGAPLAP